jgi:hypothetical protein
MNTGTNTESSQEFLPGLYRTKQTSGTTLTFKWFYGAGRVFNKVIEVLLLVFGIVTAAASFDGIIHLFAGQGNFTYSLMSIFFFICGILLAYRGLSIMVNRSLFIVSNQGLSVRHGPLPGAANFDLMHHEIARVEWRKVGHSSRSSSAGGGISSGYTATFDVILTTNTGKTITLVSGISAREYAFAIASEISTNLKK